MISKYTNKTYIRLFVLYIMLQWKKYSHSIVYGNVALIKNNYYPFQLYVKRPNHRNTTNEFPPHLNVKVRLPAVTHGGKYVVTGIGQLVEITIKCGEVEVSPSTADLSIMSSTYQQLHSVKFDITLYNWQ